MNKEFRIINRIIFLITAAMFLFYYLRVEQGRFQMQIEKGHFEKRIDTTYVWKPNN